MVLSRRTIAVRAVGRGVIVIAGSARQTLPQRVRKYETRL